MMSAAAVPTASHTARFRLDSVGTYSNIHTQHGGSFVECQRTAQLMAREDAMHSTYSRIYTSSGTRREYAQ